MGFAEKIAARPAHPHNDMSYADGPGFAFPELTPAIKRLLLVNAAVFLLNAILGGELSQGSAWFAFSWSGLWDGYGLGLLRLVSYQFTHSWDHIGHIIVNMLSLYFFGTMAERALGYLGTYKLYLLGGAFAAVAHLGVSSLQGSPDVGLVGASGACFSFLVYAACMAPQTRVIVIFVPVPLGMLAGVLVFIGLYSQYVEFMTGYPGGVAHSAHLGGALFGFAAHRLGWFRDFTPYGYQQGVFAGWRQRLQQWGQQRKAQSAADEQREIDRILEKIQQQGMPSLSSGERKTLERASARAKKR